MLLVLALLTGCGDKDGGGDAGGTSSDGGAADGGSATDAGSTDGGASTDPGHNWEWDREQSVGFADGSLVGEYGTSWAGGRLTVVGDMTGDGIDDVVVPAPYVSAEVIEGGKVSLVPGRSSGWEQDESLGLHPAVWGHSEGLEFSGVRGVGDVDGDGLADLGIYSGYTNSGPPYASVVALGQTDGWSEDRFSDEVELVVSSDSEDHTVQERLGDVDGDGVDDLLFVYENGRRNTASILLGGGLPASPSLPGDADGWIEPDYNGARPEAWGDLDGDGRSDIVFGRSSDDTEASILLGSDSLPYDRLLDDVADAVLRSDAGLGWLAVWPDLDGDGNQELVSVTSARGGVGLCLGGDGWSGELEVDDCAGQLMSGQQVEGAAVGDVDGDGRIDVLVHAQDDSAAWVLAGRDDWSVTLDEDDALVTLTFDTFDNPRPPEPDQVGDLDGDGKADLVFVDPGAEARSVQEAGHVAVLRGSAEWPTTLDLADADLHIVGTETYERLGEHLILSDVDGDGRSDVLLSSYYRPLDLNTGEVFIFLGQDAP